MSEWIESHSNLPRHRKTLKLARALGVAVPEALGYMHMLWYYVLDFAPGGDLTGHDAQSIADGCMYSGDAEKFVSAFVDAGWLDVTQCHSDKSDGLFVHDWTDCNQSHRKRILDAERQRLKRHRERDSGGMSQNVTVTPVTVTPDRQDRQDRTDRTGQENALATLAIEEVPKSESTIEDYAKVIDKARRRVSDQTIERTILELANYRPAKPRAKWHLTLAAWLLKCPAEPVPASHVPFEDKDELPGVPPPPEVSEMMRQIGAWPR